MLLGINILYGTSTGNSQEVALIIKNTLMQQHRKSKIKTLNVVDTESPYSFKMDYIYILVISTWGIDPATPQEDFEIFWHNIKQDTINGVKFIIIGLGDSYYPFFCQGAKDISKDIIGKGGLLLFDPLLIQDPYEDHIMALEKLVAQIKD